MEFVANFYRTCYRHVRAYDQEIMRPPGGEIIFRAKKITMPKAVP